MNSLHLSLTRDRLGDYLLDSIDSWIIYIIDWYVLFDIELNLEV